MSIEWGDAPAWVASAVAVIAAGIAAWQAREARKARQSSETAATRSNEIAQRALELQEAAARAAEPPKVAWQIEHVRNLLFHLRNIGTDRATGVWVEDRRADGKLTRKFPEGAEIGANQTHDLLLLEVGEYPMPGEVWVRWDGVSEAVAVPLSRR